MEAYKLELAQDSKAKKLFKNPIVVPKKTKNVMMSLIDSILGQQLSIQVAAIMRERFLGLYQHKIPTPLEVLETPNEKIKAIGISQSKANYIQNVAQFFYDHDLSLKKLNKMSDQEIIDLLTQIKGVGRWTVEMLLIFGLKREDVFALDDLGVQKAMIELFGLHELPKKQLKIKMEKLSKRWSPYRSYICLHMWRFTIPKK